MKERMTSLARLIKKNEDDRADEETVVKLEYDVKRVEVRTKQLLKARDEFEDEQGLTDINNQEQEI